MQSPHQAGCAAFRGLPMAADKANDVVTSMTGKAWTISHRDVSCVRLRDIASRIVRLDSKVTVPLLGGVVMEEETNKEKNNLDLDKEEDNPIQNPRAKANLEALEMGRVRRLLQLHRLLLPQPKERSKLDFKTRKQSRLAWEQCKDLPLHPQHQQLRQHHQWQVRQVNKSWWERWQAFWSHWGLEKEIQTPNWARFDWQGFSSRTRQCWSMEEQHTVWGILTQERSIWTTQRRWEWIWLQDQWGWGKTRVRELCTRQIQIYSR